MGNLRNFYCYACNHETLGEIKDIQTAKGIVQSIICTNCGNIISLELLNSINRMMEEEIYLKSKNSIDPKTGFTIGSQEYNDYYYPKIDKTGMHR